MNDSLPVCARHLPVDHIAGVLAPGLDDLQEMLEDLARRR